MSVIKIKKRTYRGYVLARNDDGTVNDLKIFFRFDYEMKQKSSRQKNELIPTYHSPAATTTILTETSIQFNTGDKIFLSDGEKLGAVTQVDKTQRKNLKAKIGRNSTGFITKRIELN